MKVELTSCFKAAFHFRLGVLLSWQAKISRGSVFDHILRYPTVQDASDYIKYIDAEVIDMLRFIRNVFNHYRHAPGGNYLELRHVEWVLSEIFCKVLLNIYCGMCMFNTFLNS